MPRDAVSRWLLLIHQLPAKPAYARVKVWRRLQALGAVTVKGSVYALPANSDAQESAKIVRPGRVEPGGGIQSICEAVCNRIDRDCGRRMVSHFDLLSMKMALSAKFTDSNL